MFLNNNVWFVCLGSKYWEKKKWYENTQPLSADTAVKNWQNLPISITKADLLNINAHTKFGENPLIFTQFIIWKI